MDKLSDEMEILIEEDWQDYLSLGRVLTGGETGVRDAERKVRVVERQLEVCSLKGGTDG